MLILLRFLAILVALGVTGCVLAYLFSGARKYLSFAWRLLRYAFILLLLIFALLVLERLLPPHFFSF